MWASWIGMLAEYGFNAQVMEAARLWQEGLLGGELIRRCMRRPWAGGVVSADAMAAGERASLGGWWMESGNEDWQKAFWFRLELGAVDLAPWVQIKGDWGHDIVFFEALLAQLVLLFMRTSRGEARGAQMHQWWDNETTVWAKRKKLSTAEPLSWALQAWEFWKRKRNVEVCVVSIGSIK